VSVGRHIARLLIDCEAKDGETKKAHLSVSLFDNAYGAGTRRTVSCCEGRGFARPEFGGFCGVPLRVAINKSASYGVWWNRIGELLLGNTYTAWRENYRFISVPFVHQLQRHIRWHWRGILVEVDRQPPENDVGVDAMADGDTGHRGAW